MIGIKIFRLYLLITLTPVLFFAQDKPGVTWNLDRTDSIGGFQTIPLNELPRIIITDLGKESLFDGIDDAMLINTNPLEDAREFTIEAIIKPDSSLNLKNKEQRFIHIRNGDDDNRRILLELRLSPPTPGKANQQWVFDTFIKSENSRCTLIDTSEKHYTGKWFNTALVYKNGTMTHFVNGVKEMSGQVEYLPIIKGKISIGSRQDPRNWFKGAIKTIKFSKHALEPYEFLPVPPDQESID